MEGPWPRLGHLCPGSGQAATGHYKACPVCLVGYQVHDGEISPHQRHQMVTLDAEHLECSTCGLKCYLSLETGLFRPFQYRPKEFSTAGRAEFKAKVSQCLGETLAEEAYQTARDKWLAGGSRDPDGDSKFLGYRM